MQSSHEVTNAFHEPAVTHLGARGTSPPDSLRLVPLGHPSLDDAVGRFRVEMSRSSGRREADRRESSNGMAAVVDGRVVGIAEIDGHRRLHVLVHPEWTGRGMAMALLGAGVDRAGRLGITRLELRHGRRTRAVRRVAGRLGVVVIETDPGRLELLLPDLPVSHSA